MSEETREELQTDQDHLRQEDHRNRELEPYDLQHKSTEEQLRETQEELKKARETSVILQSQISKEGRPHTPVNQKIPHSGGRLSIASSVFRDQLLTDIF